MNQGTYKALVLSARDYKENDKLLRLLTLEDGIITAIMRGVKKPAARLRFGAIPFAFCEYTLTKSKDFFVVTACTQIEDLFSIAEDFDSYSSACIMLECADFATGQQANAPLFVRLLKSLNLVLYSPIDPYLVAVAFVQKTIHEAGYGYSYASPPQDICSALDLLSLLNAQPLDKIPKERLEGLKAELILKTLAKLIANFEGKFDVSLASKKLLTK